MFHQVTLSAPLHRPSSSVPIAFWSFLRSRAGNPRGAYRPTDGSAAASSLISRSLANRSASGFTGSSVPTA
uniref:Secreted protein n=1 Tax=Steinernema glaseri TaxID=37863 RepID=A0A1I7Z6S0_9BILA